MVYFGGGGEREVVRRLVVVIVAIVCILVRQLADHKSMGNHTYHGTIGLFDACCWWVLGCYSTPCECGCSGFYFVVDGSDLEASERMASIGSLPFRLPGCLGGYLGL